MIRTLLAFFIFLISSSQSLAAESKEIILEKAQNCTEEISNLHRLACFDAVFSTPVHTFVHDNKPESWVRAKNTELTRHSSTGPLLTISENEKDMWITMRALNMDDNTLFPSLILSCISGISRIEMALPSPIDAGRVNMTFDASSTERWRSDDSGLLISSGRGFIAINQMKTILSSSRLVLHSNNKTIDGLAFDTENLKDSIEPLREQCGW